MKQVTYYNHIITFNEEEEVFEYSLVGWDYQVKTLEEAKKDIKENWRNSLYFYNHCL
mgnify:CR=1 FL=1